VKSQPQIEQNAKSENKSQPNQSEMSLEKPKVRDSSSKKENQQLTKMTV
jgi:hypothetical protein